MKKILISLAIILFSWLLFDAPSAQAGQVVGISEVHYDPNARTAGGFSGTYVDYTLYQYYDPWVFGAFFFQDDPESPIAEGGGYGVNSQLPPPYNLIGFTVFFYTTDYRLNKTYCTGSDHRLLAYYYYIPTGQWFDPHRISWFLPTSGGNQSGWYGYPFTYYYVVPRLYRLGTTLACITTPMPTPSPTPTPTPSPTPCPDSNGNAAPCPTPSPTPTPTPSPTPENAQLIITPESIRPTGTTGGTNTARVEVRVTPARAGWRVSLQLLSIPNTGGHIDAFHTGQRPTGRLRTRRGTTDASGIFQTTYTPSHISGRVGIVATIENLFSLRRDVTVRVPLLFELEEGEDYNLIGNERTPEHPSNHWGTAAANERLRLIARNYREFFYDPNPIPENEKLHYNDMSLEWGGKFDLGRNWSDGGSHRYHREGLNCDVRCCQDPGNVPRDRWDILKDIFRFHESPNFIDETTTSAPHWHLVFEFGQAQIPVQRTPGNFVDSTWWGSLEREATQDEWLQWTERLESAKAQGQPQLLAEAKALERERFLSAEYVARSRNDEKFIVDLFQGYLLREPTRDEVQYWLEVLRGIPAPPPDNRSLLLDQFENQQEFANLIYSLVDEPPPSNCEPKYEEECIKYGGIWDSVNCVCALSAFN